MNTVAVNAQPDFNHRTFYRYGHRLVEEIEGVQRCGLAGPEGKIRSVINILWDRREPQVITHKASVYSEDLEASWSL